MFHKFLLCFSLLLCNRKSRRVLKKIVVFWKHLLCSRKDCCVLEDFVVFSKRLLCTRKYDCVSQEKLSCVLPLWATVKYCSRVFLAGKRDSS